MTSIEQTICHWENCGRVFKNNTDLKVHYGDHLKPELNDKNQEVWRCQWDSCNRNWYTFVSKSSIMTHMRIHSRPIWLCNCGCSQTFPTKAALEKHQANYRYECRIAGCEKFFSSTTGRNRHEKTHTPTKHYCPSCNYECKTKTTLINHHLRKHNEKLPLKYRTEVVKAVQKVEIEVPKPEPVINNPFCYFDPDDQVVPEPDQKIDFTDLVDEDAEYENYTAEVAQNYCPQFFTEEDILNATL